MGPRFERRHPICPPLSDFSVTTRAYSLIGGQKAKWFRRVIDIRLAIEFDEKIRLLCAAVHEDSPGALR
jgi:hypothetical protein